MADEARGAHPEQTTPKTFYDYHLNIITNNKALQALVVSAKEGDLEVYKKGVRWLNLFVLNGGTSVVDLFREAIEPKLVPIRTEGAPEAHQFLEAASDEVSTAIGRVTTKGDEKVYKGYLFDKASPVYFTTPVPEFELSESFETNTWAVSRMQSACCGTTWVVVVDPDMSLFVGSLDDPRFCHSGRLTFAFSPSAKPPPKRTRWLQAFLIAEESADRLTLQYAYCLPKSQTVLHRTLRVDFVDTGAAVRTSQTIEERRRFDLDEDAVALLYSSQMELLVVTRRTVRTIQTNRDQPPKKPITYRLPEAVSSVVLAGELIPGCYALVAKSSKPKTYLMIVVDLVGESCHAEVVVSEELNQIVSSNWQADNPCVIHRLIP